MVVQSVGRQEGLGPTVANDHDRAEVQPQGLSLPPNISKRGRGTATPASFAASNLRPLIKTHPSRLFGPLGLTGNCRRRLLG